MIFRLIPLVILAAPALAQESGANASFYHAYWLDHGADRYREAIAAYQKFLSEAPDNKHAPSAAASLLSLLYRTGDTQAADEFKKSHSQLIAKDQKRFSNRLQAGSTSDSRQPGTVMRNRIADMKKQQREAKEKGDETTSQRLSENIRRMEEALRRAGDGRNQRGSRTRLTEMNKEQIKDYLRRTQEFSKNQIRRLRENGNTEQADRLAESIKKFRDLIMAGKIEEAQKALDSRSRGTDSRSNQPPRRRSTDKDKASEEDSKDSGSSRRGTSSRSKQPPRRRSKDDKEESTTTDAQKESRRRRGDR